MCASTEKSSARLCGVVCEQFIFILAPLGERMRESASMFHFVLAQESGRTAVCMAQRTAGEWHVRRKRRRFRLSSSFAMQESLGFAWYRTAGEWHVRKKGRRFRLLSSFAMQESGVAGGTVVELLPSVNLDLEGFCR